jgi:hypothetical protein
MAPRFTPGDRSSVLCWRPKRTEPVETGRAASVSGHIWAALSRVNAFLQFYFTDPPGVPLPKERYGSVSADFKVLVEISIPVCARITAPRAL